MQGVGDYEAPSTALEGWLAFPIMLGGVLAFSYFVGQLGFALESAEENRRRFEGRLSLFQQFAHYQNLPDDILTRVQRYYAYLWSTSSGQSAYLCAIVPWNICDCETGFDTTELLKELPDALRSDVSVALVRHITDKMDFFQGSEPGFVASVVNALKLRVCLPGEYICMAGENGNEMFFVERSLPFPSFLFFVWFFPSFSVHSHSLVSVLIFS